MSKEKTPMKDVAQEACVALGTVSKVINGIPVGKAYRIRVERIAETRQDTFEEDLREIMAGFLEHCHYAAK